MRTGLLILAVVAWASPTLGADLCEGTFKIDLAKSTFKPGPPPKSRAIRYQRSGARCRQIVDGEDANGVKSHRDFGGGTFPDMEFENTATFLVRAFNWFNLCTRPHLSESARVAP